MPCPRAGQRRRTAAGIGPGNPPLGRPRGDDKNATRKGSPRNCSTSNSARGRKANAELDRGGPPRYRSRSGVSADRAEVGFPIQAPMALDSRPSFPSARSESKRRVGDVPGCQERRSTDRSRRHPVPTSRRKLAHTAAQSQSGAKGACVRVVEPPASVSM